MSQRGSSSTNYESRVTNHSREPAQIPGYENPLLPQNIIGEKNSRDAQLRGRSTPVFPVRLRRWRARLGLRGVFVAAQKFVSFNLGYHADAAGLIDFGALDAAEASNFDGAGKRDFVG